MFFTEFREAPLGIKALAALTFCSGLDELRTHRSFASRARRVEQLNVIAGKITAAVSKARLNENKLIYGRSFILLEGSLIGRLLAP